MPVCSTIAPLMNHPRIIVDLILVLAALVALLIPLVQIAAEAHVEQTERQFARRYTEVCNVEGNLCVIASGASRGQSFGRLLPGQ
jgi:hypothetical protein